MHTHAETQTLQYVIVISLNTNKPAMSQSCNLITVSESQLRTFRAKSTPIWAALRNLVAYMHSMDTNTLRDAKTFM